MSLAQISKITLPGGVTYEIKDAYAREVLAAGIKFVVSWDGNSEPVVANIPAGVKVTWNKTEYIGTKSAETAQPLTFYLVKTDEDVYAEYVAIGEAGSKSWEKLGDTSVDLSDLGALAYKDQVILTKSSVAAVVSASAAATASNVTFSEGAGSDFVTGYATEAVAPSFTEGAFNSGSLPSFSEGAFTPASIAEGFFSAGSLPSKAADTFSTGTLPSKDADTFSAGELPSLGAASTSSFVTGYNNDYEAPSLGAASKSAFAEAGIVVEYVESGLDAETLVFSLASTASAVTEQGTFSAGKAATLATASAVTAQGAFSAGSLPSFTEGAFNSGSLPSFTEGAFNSGSLPSIDATKFNGGSKASDTWDAGTLPSKAADTFNAGSAATLAKAKALTADVTGSAAAQNITVSTDTASVAAYDDLAVTVS